MEHNKKENGMDKKKEVSGNSGAQREMTLEELRLSPDRAVWVEDKNAWDDRWTARQLGQEHYYILPVKQEKHVPYGEGEKFAKGLKGELLPVFVLVSLYDYEKRCMVPAAVKMGFKTDDWYWAKELSGNPDYARVVNLRDGSVIGCSKDGSGYVRPVRLSQ